MIKLILYTIFVSMLSSFLTIKLKSYYIKKQIKKFAEEEKKRADSVISWFKNDLMNNITSNEQAEILIRAIDHLNITLYQPTGLLALSKHISQEDREHIVKKLMNLHKNYIDFKEKNLVKLYILLNLNQDKLKDDTKIALNTFISNEKQKVLMITEEFDKIIQVLL
ncbi:MAG: hypothetical protein IKO49_03670 [Bacilli bacterium]|nr:hypothetical protein [Bacilli bacterium]